MIEERFAALRCRFSKFSLIRTRLQNEGELSTKISMVKPGRDLSAHGA
jgi:hypothetical protein